MKQDEFLKILGYQVKKRRKAFNLSQEDLAEKIDKSVDTVSNIERGKGAPRLDTALDIANTLGVELFELFQVHDMSTDDKAKMKKLDTILDLLKDQPDEMLDFTLKQTQLLVSLKESFIDKLKK